MQLPQTRKPTESVAMRLVLYCVNILHTGTDLAVSRVSCHRRLAFVVERKRDGVHAKGDLGQGGWADPTLGPALPRIRDGDLRHPELKVRTPAHTKQLGWYVEFESRVTHVHGTTGFPFAASCGEVDGLNAVCSNRSS